MGLDLRELELGVVGVHLLDLLTCRGSQNLSKVKRGCEIRTHLIARLTLRNTISVDYQIVSSNAKPNHFQEVFTDYLDDFYELVHA